MNCPSRTDEESEHPGWNQSPPSLAADLTTREDLNGISNLRNRRDHVSPDCDPIDEGLGKMHQELPSLIPNLESLLPPAEKITASERTAEPLKDARSTIKPLNTDASRSAGGSSPGLRISISVKGIGRTFIKFGKFIGPGFIISVAYIDPGNYSTDVSAGASTRFSLLFVVLMSNVFAIFLQSLAIRLGTITGLNLAEHCRAHLPMWFNIALYILAEAAIIATDIAEVIGSAIALNLLLKIPLVAGCAITLVDVLVILIFYQPNGSMRGLRAFEFFVVALVLGVVVCFCIQLSLIRGTTVGEVFKGYIPSSTIVDGKGIYLSCGVLGATVMPHSLYLGTGMVQARLRDFDAKQRSAENAPILVDKENDMPQQPSLAVIRSCLKFSIAELAIALFTFALFVNSAILIVAGASLSSSPSAANANLFDIHSLLSKTIAPIAGTVFALALLLSGTSAGIVCTITGQMISEGALNWSVAPWIRRLLTRGISITPSIIIAGAVGKPGLSAALNASQVALSVILPFVSAPLIYFTCRNKYMTVRRAEPAMDDEADGLARTTWTDKRNPQSRGNDPQQGEVIKMRNHWIVSILAVAIWLVIAIMNVAVLVLIGLGKA